MFDNKKKQAKAFISKAKQEAQKLAVAIVITEMLLVAGYAIGEEYNLFDIFRQENVIEIVNAKVIVEEPKKTDRIQELAEYIYLKESTSGKNNYSKCEAIGQYNGIGYGIPGNGKYICFNSHEEEMQVLKGWLIAKIAAGYTEQQALCIYSGSNYKECQ